MGRRPSILKQPQKFSILYSDRDPRKEIKSITGSIADDFPKVARFLMDLGLLPEEKLKRILDEKKGDV